MMDLVEKVSGYLDPQMLYMLLKFEKEKGNDYDKEIKNVLQKLFLFKDTEEYEGFDAAVEKEEVYKKRLGMLSSRAGVLVNALESEGGPHPEKRARISLDQLEGANPLMVNDVVELAGYYYAAGNFSTAILRLRDITTRLTQDSVQFPVRRNAMWGILAGSIMTALTNEEKNKRYWGFARNALKELKDAPDIDATGRSYLLHWTLFLCFRGSLPDMMREMVFRNSDAARHARRLIETKHPYYVRYLIIAAIASDFKYTSNITALINSTGYDDDVVQFARKLWIEHDFFAAAALISKVQESLSDDFFTAPVAEKLADSLRQCVILNYMRVHKRVPIKYVEDITSLAQKDAETWAVRLISDKKLMATIDSDKQEIVVHNISRSIYEDIAGILDNSQRQIKVIGKN